MDLGKIKILISDDSLLARKKLKDFLLSIGCKEVWETKNGQEAIDLYKKNKPDLVLMDIIMPEQSGIDALEKIKEFDAQAKIIMVSSVGTQSYLKEAIVAGALDFLQKPVEEEKLKKLILRIVEGEK